MKSKQKIQIQIIPSLVNVRKIEILETEKSSEFVKKEQSFCFYNRFLFFYVKRYFKRVENKNQKYLIYY